MIKQVKGFFKRMTASASMKVQMLLIMLLCGATSLMAQNTAGDYTAGTNALSTVAEEIAKYVPIMVKLCYAIAGVVAIVGAISVYIAMNNEEQDVKKKIMMVVGACIFLIAAAQALGSRKDNGDQGAEDHTAGRQFRHTWVVHSQI